MTALVERDDVKPVHQRTRYTIEPVRVGSTAVEEEERRVALLSPLQQMERQTTGGDAARTRRLADER
jgi:hypothetical protein